VGGASGKPFIVKNLFELKNAQRLLFEGNILENSWGGFSQKGYAIVITPKNQSPNVCPLCKVVDVTLRYNRVAHMGGGMELANVLSDTKGVSTAGERYSIHDMVFEDIDADKYDGFGMFALVMSVNPTLRDVWLDHITAFPPRVLFGLSGAAGGPRIAGFVFRNSIVGAGERQLTSTGGGLRNCAGQQPHPQAMVSNCFQDPNFNHNAIVGAQGNWPSGNWFPKSFSDVGLSVWQSYVCCLTSSMRSIGLMDAREIVAGSVVQLKSGGPLMTVQQVADHWGTLTAWCDWFVQDTL